ncbi:hypothetical protein [Thermus sp. 2.9]|nr:hypothetical protein [Thermus sp. 2.9]
MRGAVAENPNTPPETLERLAGDESGEVREKVAEHPNHASRTPRAPGRG